MRDMNFTVFIVWALMILATVLVAPILHRYFDNKVYYALYAGLTIGANIMAVKLILLGNLFVVPAAVVAYSVTFLLTDIVDEIYGRAEAHKVVMLGFVANMVVALAIYITTLIPAPQFVAGIGQMYDIIMRQTPRIFIASVVAYLISQNYDVWAFSFWKKVTRGRHLWIRNNASTMVSQLIDTVIFITLAFYGVVPNTALVGMILGQYVVKVIIALLDTPFMYLAVYLERKLGNYA